MKRRLSPNAVTALIGLGLVLIVVSGYLMLIAPQRSKAAKLRQDAVKVEQQIAANRAAAAAPRPKPKPVHFEVGTLFQLVKAMPSRSDVPGLLLQIDQTASDAHVKLTSFSPGGAGVTSGPSFQPVPFSVTVGGTFFAVTDFLARLRGLVQVEHGRLDAVGRLIAVNGVNLNSAGGGGVAATVQLEAYVYTGSASAAPPAAGASAAPSAPTTGSTG